MPTENKIKIAPVMYLPLFDPVFLLVLKCIYKAGSQLPLPDFPISLTVVFQKYDRARETVKSTPGPPHLPKRDPWL